MTNEDTPAGRPLISLPPPMSLIYVFRDGDTAIQFMDSPIAPLNNMTRIERGILRMLCEEVIRATKEQDERELGS